MTIIKKKLGSASVYAIAACAGLAVFPTMAWAQDAQVSDASEEAGTVEQSAPTRAEESDGMIVVTATRREGTTFDIPAAVSAVGAEAIEFRGVSQTSDLVGMVPSLQISEQTGAALVTIRGVGLIVDTGYAEPAVAVYSGGIYQPRTGSGLLNSLDLERIEVLRGPQGTLYGRNATGGVINFIPTAPTEYFEGEVAVGGGSLDSINGRMMLSGPLSDGVQVRVAATGNKRDGYIRNLTTGNIVGDQSQWGGRASVRFLPTDNLTIDVIGQFQRASMAPVSVLVTPPTALDQSILQAATGQPVAFTLERDAQYEESDVENGRLQDWSVSTQFKLELNDVDVKLLLGYVEGVNRFDVPQDALSTPFIEIARDDLSQAYSAELNLSGGSDKFEWILGAYAFKEDYDANLNFRFPSTELIPGLPGLVLYSNGVEENKNIGLFGDVTFHVTDKLQTYAGLRYGRDEKSMVQNNLAILGPPPGIATVDACTFAIPETRSFSRSWDNFSPRVGFQYAASSDVNFYGQFQVGSKSGGWNFSEPCGNPFEQEKVNAYEAGVKTQLGGGSSLNLTGFYYDYSNLQVFTSRVTTAFVVNAPEARIYGAELEGRAKIVPGLSVDAAATLLHARYTEFVDTDIVTGGTFDLDGEPLSRAPDFTMNMGVQYDTSIDLGLFSSMMIRTEAFHTSKIAYRPYSPEDQEDGYWLFNAFLQFDGPDDNYSFRLFARNIGDKQYLTQIFGGGVATSGYRKATVGLPRTIGGEVIFSF